MRVLITGVDGDGHSCIVSEKTVPDPSAGRDDAEGVTHFSGAVIEMLYSAAASPPPRSAGSAMSVDIGTPGITNWFVVDRGPGTASPLHHTDSIDFDVVMEGSLDIVLDDGPHRLDAGDCVVITGVDHGWQAGPEGCRYLVLVTSAP